MQRAGVVVLVLVAGVAVVAAVALNGPGDARETASEPIEEGDVRVPLERAAAPPLSVPEEADPRPLAVPPEEDEEAGAEGVGEAPIGEVETAPLDEGAHVLASPPRDLTRIQVTIESTKQTTVATVLQQLGDDHGFTVEYAPGTKEVLEDCSLTLNLEAIALADALRMLGQIGRMRIEIRDGKVHVSDL